jgi:hypothetical protein
MGLYKGQNIITGSYMLPRVDDIRQINISRERRSKQKKKMKRNRSRKEGRKTKKKHKFTPFTTRGLTTFEEKEYIA